MRRGLLPHVADPHACQRAGRRQVSRVRSDRHRQCRRGSILLRPRGFGLCVFQLRYVHYRPRAAMARRSASGLDPREA